MNHLILFNKFKEVPIYPYIINWVRDFLSGRQQRVVADGLATSIVSINKGVPQGTILGPVLFSIMLNDIKVVNTNRATLIKYADDLTLSSWVRDDNDASLREVQNITDWATSNRMTINVSKTKELVVRGKVERPKPNIISSIEQVCY